MEKKGIKTLDATIGNFQENPIEFLESSGKDGYHWEFSRKCSLNFSNFWEKTEDYREYPEKPHLNGFDFSYFYSYLYLNQNQLQ